MPGKVLKNDLLYPELSYQIIGILFEVFNELGYRYKEVSYQKAISLSLKNLGINFQEQVRVPLIFKGVEIGDYIPDFLIDRKVVLEIKRGDYFSQADIKQLLSYLKIMKLKLGILARFSPKGLKFKRIVNIK